MADGRTLTQSSRLADIDAVAQPKTCARDERGDCVHAHLMVEVLSDRGTKVPGCKSSRICVQELSSDDIVFTVEGFKRVKSCVCHYNVRNGVRLTLNRSGGSFLLSHGHPVAVRPRPEDPVVSPCVEQSSQVCGVPKE